jgi:hypothetical protein
MRLLSRAICLSGLVILPIVAQAQQLWFSPGDDLEVRGVIAHPDFQQLFTPGAPWPNGMAHVDVMQLRAPWFLRMPNDAVQPVVTFLRQHHIALAVPMSGIAADTCGAGVEGILTSRAMEVYPREMKKKRINLSYAVLDEPLYFGHYYNGNNACNFSISEVADRVAQNVKIIKKYYPDIKVVWVEPVQGLSNGVQAVGEFLDEYRAELNELPVAVRLDVQWQRDWRHALPPFIDLLETRGMAYGIIYNATKGGVSKSDAEWVASAEANVEAFETAIREKPGEVVIQTWNPRPVRILPESDPTTMTGFLNWYVDQRQ